ncbi:tsf [Symbiodinium pilosum]|uniref:Elongation factor Ts, mitochondrial n=1 Tax=Symbiodinium pilosum TaxID=2952 RepID=A0A812JQ66_SYMPI|nr:tsf [Symbiodinium pilosum]
MRQLLRLCRPTEFCSKLQRVSPHAAAFQLPSRRFCAVSVAQVKELRDRTGASMGKCREALKEESGDLDKAVDWLKKRGVRSMEKRAAESVEALLSLGLNQHGVIVELRAETDFVTRSEIFQQTLRHLANMLVAAPDVSDAGVEAVLGMRIADGPDRPSQFRTGAVVSEALLELGSVLGEKLVLANVQFLAAPAQGVVGGYVHPKSADGLPGTGRMAGLVAVRSERCDPAALQTIASRLVRAFSLLNGLVMRHAQARHVVAAQPRFLNVSSVPAETLRKEREVFKAAYFEQLGPRKAGGMDEKVIQKVLDGKTAKFYQDSVFACQELIAPQVAGGKSDQKALPVSEWLEAEARSLSASPILIEDFKLAVL